MDTDDLSGKVFVTSGLGGMSGAQAKVQEYLNGFKKYFYGKTWMMLSKNILHE